MRAWQSLALVTVPDRNIGKSKQFAAHRIGHQNRMQQKAAELAALANWAIAPPARLPAAEHNLAGILDRQNIASGNPLCNVPGSAFAQPCHRHCRVAQKPPKSDLATTLAASQSQNARTR